jgi:hypothetical protein
VRGFTALKGLTRTLLALLCTIGSLFAAPALAGAHPLVGIGENTTAIFSDPRFLALGITQVRDDIAWNALSVPRARADLAAWLGDAQADGLTPLITFDHVVGNVRTEQRLPSVAQFSRAFLKFRKLYPWVTDFETWDEANFYLEGTAFAPKRAAQFYLALRRDCPSCTILASDLLDVPKDGGRPDGQVGRRVHPLRAYAAGVLGPQQLFRRQPSRDGDDRAAAPRRQGQDLVRRDRRHRQP